MKQAITYLFLLSLLASTPVFVWAQGKKKDAKKTDELIHIKYDEEKYDEQFDGDGLVRLRDYRPKTSFMTTKTLVDSIAKLNHKITHLQEGLIEKGQIKLRSFLQLDLQRNPIFDDGTGSQGLDLAGNAIKPRGRVELTHDSELGVLVFSGDITERDIKLTDLYFDSKISKTIAMRGGIFFIPFGMDLDVYETERDAPDKTRVFNSLFNTASRDIGLITVITPKSNSFMQGLKVEVGTLNGSGSSNVDLSAQKAVVGRLSMKKVFEKVPFGVRAAFSFYSSGYNISSTNKVYKSITKDEKGGKSYDEPTSGQAPRSYYAASGAVDYDLGFGPGVLSGEYVFGNQTGIYDNAISPKENFARDADLYVRTFEGWYVKLVQSIPRTTMQVILRADWFDPNRQVSPLYLNQETSVLTPGDLKFVTVGGGMLQHYNKQLTYVLFAELGYNTETSPYIAGYEQKTLKYGITIRMQYTFP